MKNFVIVIGRQYGAGGRKLGKLLAEKLNIGYYDKELLAEAAASRGISADFLLRSDEKRPSMLRSLLSYCYGSNSQDYSPYCLTEENIYRLQSEVIESIAANESCVIVGRTADHILRNHPKLLSIFVHSPSLVRADSIVKRGECSSLQQATDLLIRKDREREDYYNYYTNRRWGAASNYDLSIDSSKFPLEVVADLIASQIGK